MAQGDERMMRQGLRIDAIWLACGAADLRAGMDTLLARVVHSFESGAQPHTAYVFANRSASRLKVLLMDGSGLWLFTRRLSSKRRFIWPQDETAHVAITTEQWDWLIAGAPWAHLGTLRAITVV
jgi:transposase